MDWFSNTKQSDAKKFIAQLGDVGKRDQAAQELIKLGAEAVPALLDALQTPDLNLALVYERILARIPSASPMLINALCSAHPLIRGRVAEVFALSRDKAPVPALIEALRGEFYTVRARAALALGKIGDPAAIPPLLAALKDKENEVRIAACEALGGFKDPTTFDELANVLLDDPKIEVRQAAVKALGDSENPLAIPYLMESLRDSFWWYERDKAISDLLTAIEKMGQPVVEPLIEALGEREGTVRKLAATILGRLKDIRAIDELGMALYDLHHEVSEAAAAALSQFGAPAIGILSEALRHPEVAVREHAIIGLGEIQDARITPLLIKMLADPDRAVRIQTIHSLGKIQDDRARKALQEIALDRTDRDLSALAKQVLEVR